ncbi:MAG TPA: hypothetical protein VHL10_03195 [Nitrososphaera sp.]|jgi:hypothetical protein|nr:hypothetical protein [Nitrososphaera sp.]
MKGNYHRKEFLPIVDAIHYCRLLIQGRSNGQTFHQYMAERLEARRRRREYMRALERTPEQKEKKRKRDKRYRARPEIKERRRELGRVWARKRRAKMTIEDKRLRRIKKTNWQREWRMRNPDKVRAYNQARRKNP